MKRSYNLSGSCFLSAHIEGRSIYVHYKDWQECQYVMGLTGNQEGTGGGSFRTVTSVSSWRCKLSANITQPSVVYPHVSQ